MFMRKLIAIIMCLCVCFLSSVNGFAYATESSSTPSYISEDVLAFSDKANDFHQRLLASWEGEYPDYYAGAYIEGQKFYILVTCEPKTAQAEVNQVAGSDICSIIRVDYPYNMLVAVYEDINNRFQNTEPNEIMKLITGWKVNEVDNCITVSVCSDINVDAEIIEYLGYGDDVIEIEYVDGQNERCYTPVVAGYQDWIYHGDTMSTLGFCASRQNSAGVYEHGFVIAGHAGELYDVVSIGSTPVGVVSARKYSGNCDASFVNMNNVESDYSRTGLLSSNYRITSHRNVGVVGTTYESHGMRTGIVTGTVDSLSCSTFYSGDFVLLTGMIGMNIAINSGDSGSPLVYPTGSSSRSLVGTLSGKNGAGTYGYYTKFSNIVSALNVELYYDIIV